MEKQATKITQLVEDFQKSAFSVFVVLWRQCFLYCRNKTFLCEALTQPNRWTRTWPRILMVVFLFLLTTSKCLWNWNYTQISWMWRCFKACLCWWNKTSKSYFPCDHKNAKMWAASPYQQLLRVGQFIDAFCKKKSRPFSYFVCVIPESLNILRLGLCLSGILFSGRD